MSQPSKAGGAETHKLSDSWPSEIHQRSLDACFAGANINYINGCILMFPLQMAKYNLNRCDVQHQRDG